MRFVIITGMSGAGKTQALRILEDNGYFCVDNLPPKLLPPFIALCNHPQTQVERIAVSMDLRGGMFFEDIEGALTRLTEANIPYEICFMDATDETLIRRFKETRRPHPLGGGRRLLDSILDERDRLSPIRDQADVLLYTDGLSTSALRKKLLPRFAGERTDGMQVNIVSFGFKRSVPLDADMVFDVRFLKNPYYDPALRDHTGLEACISRFVMDLPETPIFLGKLMDMLLYLLPLFERENKKQVVLAIGCTGGKHRSVVLANQTGERLREAGYHVAINHRDIGRETGA